VAIKSDVEIGGSDQLFNLKVGRELQQIFGQKPQDIMELKMLSGTDGRKMSTSWGNVININDKPEDMFGKLMSVRDELILDYFELCTRISEEELEEIRESLEKKKINPVDLKEKLAEKIVDLYYGKREAEKARQGFEAVFRQKKNPANMPEERISRKEMNILELLVEAKLTPSKTEAKRLVLQKAVEIDGKVKSDWKETIEVKKGMVLRAGKRRFAKIA
jgi:tyrosyl-tRNA synthetase